MVLSGCGSPGPDIADKSSDLFASEAQMLDQAECLERRGWIVDMVDGAIVAEIPVAQGKLYQSDSEECAADAGIDASAPLSDDQLELVYAWYSEIADCLTGAGYPVPSRPSVEVFTEAYDSDPWIPWTLLEGSDYVVASRECPVLVDR